MKTPKFKITEHAIQAPLKDGRIVHQEASLDRILEYYVKDYELPKGEKILRATWFVDQPRGTVIYRLIIGRDKAL